MQAFAPVSKSAPRRRAEKWRTTTILLCACCRWTRPPVEIFDIETGAELGMVVGGGNTVTGVAISPDEETGYFTSSYLPSCVACFAERAATVPYDSLTSFDLETFQLERSLATGAPADGAVIAPDGSTASPDDRYNRAMVAKTVHVFPSDGSWEVKREGKSGKMFVTQREAVDAARKTVKKDSAGQFAVHGKDGQIREHGAYRMTPVQDPPKRSSRANDIARAVGKVALIRVKSNAFRERPSKS